MSTEGGDTSQYKDAIRLVELGDCGHQLELMGRFFWLLNYGFSRLTKHLRRNNLYYALDSLRCDDAI